VRQAVIPGGSLEVLTPAEAADLIAAGFRENVTTRVRVEGSGVADATGFLSLDLYTVPAGWEFELRRYVVTIDGFTPGNQFTIGAGGYAYFARSGELILYVLSAGTTPKFPYQDSFGEEQGPYIRNNETLQFVIIVGPVSTRMQVQAEGILRRPPERT
jgi:hypothetical protein